MAEGKAKEKRLKVKVQGWVQPSTLEDAIEVYAASCEDLSFSEFLERLLLRAISEHRAEVASQYDGEAMS